VGAGLFIWNFFRHAPRFDTTDQDATNGRNGVTTPGAPEVRVAT
jgi:hypothetical protein